jgi:hypothetical protein
VIDWANVALNGVWIAGAAILVAALSYHRWLAQETSVTFKSMRARRSWKISVSAGMALVCLGVGCGLADRRWERVLWTGLLIGFGFQLATDWRAGRKPAVRVKRSS